MRRTVLVALCVFGLVGLEPASAAAPTVNQQIVAVLKIARHADATARAALRASKRVPTTVRGLDGAAGPSGAQGLSGAPGVAGQTGVNGANGIAGVQGPKGDQGPQGVAGPAGLSVKAYGHVTADGTGTTTQGATVTHPGSGLYCVTDSGFVAVVVTPDSWNATAFALPPSSPSGSCGPAWTVVVSNNSGIDTGFYMMAN